MQRPVWYAAWVFLLCLLVARSCPAVEVENVVVYSEPGRFGGWPANHGIWSWGNEILVGFAAAYYKDQGPYRHAVDHERPEEHLLARSLDGGKTWRIENPAEQGALLPRGVSLHGTELPRTIDRPWVDCPGGIDFTNPNFAMTWRMTDVHSGPSRFYYSTDRGHQWQGPFKVPNFGQPGVSARTDYIVLGPQSCLVFLTAAKSNGREGRPVAAGTTDGGKTWKFLSWIAPEPAGYCIMPSTVRLDERSLLCTVRVREGDRSWLDCYYSPDLGQTWQARPRAVEDTGEGNPSAMLKLADGRVCLTYGVRAKPFGMRAKLSSDQGQTWSPEIILRADGGGRDLGYPRSVQRPDGKVVTVYYFNDDPMKTRTIEATIWDPATALP